jgi:hypothetical protein
MNFLNQHIPNFHGVDISLDMHLLIKSSLYPKYKAKSVPKTIKNKTALTHWNSTISREPLGRGRPDYLQIWMTSKLLDSGRSH